MVMKSHVYTVTVGSKGDVVIPKALRQRFQIQAGSLLVIDEDGEGRLSLRKAVAVPVEKYSDHRKAEFLLNAAIDAEEYRQAVEKVRAMGIDPDSIPHEPIR